MQQLRSCCICPVSFVILLSLFSSSTLYISILQEVEKSKNNFCGNYINIDTLDLLTINSKKTQEQQLIKTILF